MHTPVMLDEVLEFLAPESGKIFVDGTLGLGGHAFALLQKIRPDGQLIGFEQDQRNYVLAQQKLAPFAASCQLYNKNFVTLQETLSQLGVDQVDGLFLDLGISSAHLDEAERGFSFRLDGPLDMRMDQRQQTTAAELIRSASVEKLEHIFRDYGEEPHAQLYARKIVASREQIAFDTTRQLADFIAHVAPYKKRLGGGHPAALAFQALRIAVNSELDVLEQTLHQALQVLAPSGRIVILSFHSLEDRIVKQFFKHYSSSHKQQKYPSVQNCPQSRFPLKILTKKAMLPTKKEMQENPRARSVRLRAAEKIL